MIKCTFTKKEIKTYDRCTVCTLTGLIPVLYEMLDEEDWNWLENHPSVRAEYHSNIVEFTVAAKALQSVQDDFSAFIGARLAESRAKKRAYNFCRSLCKRIAERLNSSLGAYAEAMEKFEIYVDKEIEHQNEILASNESC